MDAMLARMTPEEFTEWMAADSLDGVIGNERLIRTLALVGAGLMAAWGCKVDPEMFMPGETRKEESLPPSAGAAVFGAWVERLKG